MNITDYEKPFAIACFFHSRALFSVSETTVLKTTG